MCRITGYDVWLGNTRGNTWSRAHVSLEPCPTCSQFWDFSFDESGRFDYAAEIDHILSVTGKHSFIFVLLKRICSATPPI